MKRDITERLESVMNGSGVIRAISEPVRGLMNRLFLESPLHVIKNLMNGTFLEHPLHPVITDVPVGGWTITLLLDLAALLFGVQNLGLASGIALGFANLAALATIITGLFDWMDTDPPDRYVGATHGIIQIVATVLFIISFFMRSGDNWRITWTYTVIAIVGYLLMTFGAFLGGSLVYRLGTMINRNAFRVGPKDFVPAIPVTELPENKPRRVEVAGQPVLLVRRGQQVYAVGAVCSHYGGPLEKGKLEGNQIVCPWHYSHFSIQDGSYKSGPTTSPLPLYDARIENGVIQIRVHTEPRQPA